MPGGSGISGEMLWGDRDPRERSWDGVQEMSRECVLVFEGPDEMLARPQAGVRNGKAFCVMSLFALNEGSKYNP